jgi:hypothetical protein
MASVHFVGQYQTDHCVTEKFQTLVRRFFLVLGRIRRVRERELEERNIPEAVADGRSAFPKCRLVHETLTK